MSQEDFGKDMGLVHQAVLTGRRVGAGRTFWTCLAHNDDLFKKIVKVAEQELAVTDTDKAAVKEWTAKIRESDHPYDEEESYYSRSSHSRHTEKLQYIVHYGVMKQLFRRAQFSENAAAICAGIEKCFHLAYAHSSLYWCCHYTENTKSWFHHPVWGLSVTFTDLLEGDGRVLLGHHLELEQFKTDESVQAIAAIESELKRDANDQELTKFFAEKGEELLGRSRNALHAALDKLLAMVS